MRFYPPKAALSQLTLIRRQRLLPAPGEILVREGERVDPVHVIGHALVPGEITVVSVAQRLGVRGRAVRRFLKVQSGQEVERGQVLATRGIVSGSSCRSPVDGRVIGIGGGQLVIRGPAQDVEVRAGYYGTVARVLSNRGVVIQASGALIQGTWGNGQEGFGVLRLMAEKRSDVLEGQAIDASCRGVILVGGSHLDREALSQATELHARGIVVGGLPPELLKEAEELPFPLVATEGIGAIPMSAPIFQLFTTHDGREAVIDASYRSRWERTRPEIIIALPAEAGTDRLRFEEVPLRAGDRVRAVRAPYAGLTGTVLEIPVAARTALGIRLPVAKVRPDDGRDPVLIPVANLEVPR